MITSSETLPQAPPGMVHLNTFVPVDKPETEEFASNTLAKFPDPEMMLHVPPVAAVAAKVVELLQMFWSLPAFGVIGFASTLMLTSSKDGAQTPLEIVHLNTLVPVDNPETEEFARLALAKVPVPEIIVHKPFPIVGTLPFSDVTVAQII